MSTVDLPPRQRNWYLLTGIVLGAILGLLVAWVIAPPRAVGSAPAALRPDFKDQYRLLVASAYAATGDLPRAQSRLALLKDRDPVQALTDQAQRALSAGEASGAAYALAGLAQAIQTGANNLALPVPSALTTILSTQAGISTPAGTSAVTPRPTYTPSPTPGAPFAVLGQETVCKIELPQGLLQVEVRNAAGQAVPGAELVIAWNSGEETFYTGLKPELGNGYADFRMIPGVSYTLQVDSNSVTVSNLTAPACPGDGGKTYWGGIYLVFQQPKE